MLYYVSMINRTRIFRQIIISAFMTLPVLGFVYGLIKADVNGIGLVEGLFWRIFIAIISVFNVTFTFGIPVLDEGGVNVEDIRIFIIPTFVLIIGVLMVIHKITESRK